MNKRAEFLEAQVIGIGKKAGRKPLKAKEIKLIVEKDMKRRPLGETTKPNRYLQASIRAGNRVQKALAQGDMDAAYVEKQRQLVNYQMFRVATELQDKVGVYNRRLDRRGKNLIKPGYVDPKFITPIKQLLGAYEYGRLVNATPAEALSAVADFVEKHNAEAQKPGEYEGKTILIPPQVLEEANVKNWQLMSFEDFKALHDAVAQFWKYGRDGSDEKKSDLKKKNEGHAVSIEGNGNIRKGVGTFADDNKKESRHKYLDTAVFAQLRRLPSILYELDGFKVMGDLAKDILPPLEAASVMYQDMMEEATQRIREAFKAYGSVERFFMSSQHTAFHIPELDQTLTKEQVLMMAMNQGTESNKEALVNGKEVLSQDLIDTILDRHMEKRDWDFVQEVIDIQESLWKPVYELEMRDKGVAAEKLEATPIQTKFGEYRGGYHRLKFSPNDEKAAAQSEREAATDVTRWGNAGAQTKNGSTIERVQGHGLQVKLKFDVVFDHLHETIMDVSYREAVRNASQILTSSEVRTAIANTKGPEFNTVISTILRQIAKQDDRETGGWQSTLQGVRLRFVPAIMAYNLKSAWSAWSGLTQAMTSRRLGPKRVLESMGRVLWNGAVQNGPIAEINAKSDMMRQRAKVFNRDIREANNQFGKGVYADEIAKWGYWPMMKMDKLIASIVWDAAEQQALEQGMSNQDAVYYADRMVSDTQSSGEAHELSALHGGGEIAKSLTVFGTYFSSTYNLTTEIIRGAAHDARNQNVAGKAKAYSLAAMDLFILHAVQMFIFTLIAENLPDFEDEEEWQDFYFWEMLSQVAGMVPFGLELVNTARYNFSAQTLPADSVMTQGWRAMNSLKDALPGGDEFEGKDAEAIARFFGTFLGISGTHQAVKSSEYLMTLDDEDGFSLKEFLISGDDED